MPVFEVRDGGFVATQLASGPWDPGAQHGGAPAALLAREFERTDPDEALVLARVTYEFVRPVPVGEVRVSASVVRSGRRVQLLEGSVFGEDGAELVRARALRVRRAEAARQPGAVPPPPGPDGGRENDYPGGGPMFATEAMEIRFVQGSFLAPGPATAWFRLREQLVEGEDPSPFQRLAAAGDFGNGISSILSWNEYLFINPDLTLYLERQPVGEWICLDASTSVAERGIGTAESVLYDLQGRVGRAIQALLVAPR